MAIDFSKMTREDLSKYVLEMSVKRQPEDLRFDSNQDGKITAADALAVQKGVIPSGITLKLTSAENIDNLTKQILAQGTTSRWTGTGFGGPEANARAIAGTLDKAGITDIRQFGQITKSQYVDVPVTPVTAADKMIFAEPGQYYKGVNPQGRQVIFSESQVTKTASGFVAKDLPSITETYWGNKETGQRIDPNYNKASGNIFSGTYAGHGRTNFGVEIAPDGTPYFYTQFGGDTSSMKDIVPVVGLGLSLLAPGLGTALGTALGATGATATVLGNALIQGTLAEAGGGDFTQGALRGAALSAAPIIGKELLPAELAAIPGATTAASTTTAGLLTGQPIEQALQTGLAAGAGSAVGGQVAGATGSQAAGQAVGTTTAGLLSGAPAETALIAGLSQGAGTLAQQAINAPSTSMPTPTPSGIEGFGAVSDEVYQGASDTVPSVTPGAGVTVEPVTSGLLDVTPIAPVTSNITNVSSVPTAPTTTSTLPTTTPNAGSMDMDDFWNELYAADAAQLAGQGIPQNQISEILQLSGADMTVANSMANLASQGLDANTILTGISGIEGFGAAADEVGQGAGGISGIEGFGAAADEVGGAGAAAGTGGVTGQLTAAAVRNLLNRILGTSGGGAAGAGGSAAALGRIVSALLGGGTSADGTGGLLTGLINRGIDAATAARIASDLQKAGTNLATAAKTAGAAADVPFTPYTVTTGLGTTTLGETGATATLGAEYAPIRTAALTKAQEALGAISPAQATQTLFGQLEGLQAPFRQREQESLLSRLGARGLLGFGQNVPTAGGAMRGVNPYMESLLSAQAIQQAQNALTAQQFGTQEASRQQQLAAALQTQGMGIDKATQDLLSTAGTLSAAPRNLETLNAQRQLEATLKGLGYQVPFETAAANIEAGQTGIAGQTTKDVVNAIIKEIFG